MRDSRRLGKHWEQLAEHHLAEHGLEILERGYSCRLGELDLVAIDHDELVIVEVRYRRESHFGSALESITWHKRNRIVRATRHYLMCHPEQAGLALRFDVVAVDDSAAGPRLHWLRNAFDGA
jgi:putative endonuclease